VPPDAAFMARLNLNIACNLPEPLSLTTDAKRKLGRIRKLSADLEAALRDLGEETAKALNTPASTLRLVQALAALSSSDGENSWGAIQTVMGLDETGDREAEELARSLHRDLVRLNALLTPPAEAERKAGRHENDALDALFATAFQVFENFVGKGFTLDWHEGTPVSLAAEFCMDVAAIGAPDATASSVRTAARKARERSLKVSNLRELPEYAENYRKRKR